MTTVLLAHGHPAVRAWVRDALAQAQDVEVVAEVSNCEEAWHLIQQVRWSVGVIACSLPGCAGAVEIAERAQIADIDLHLLVLGDPDHDGLLCRLWRAGALGCVSEEVAPQAIVEAVRAAARGRPLWTAAQVARAQCWWDEVGAKLEALTARERQVLSLMADGLSNRQIARRLGIGARTVQTHVANILGKLALETRQQAIVLVLKEANGYLAKVTIPQSCG